MTDISLTSLELALETDIDNWVDTELGDGNEIPDFWDENATSERLASYLVRLGWKRLPSGANPGYICPRAGCPKMRFRFGAGEG